MKSEMDEGMYDGVAYGVWKQRRRDNEEKSLLWIPKNFFNK